MANITQHEWEMILVAAFKADWSILRVLFAADGDWLPWKKGERRPKLSRERISELFSNVEGLEPSVTSTVRGVTLQTRIGLPVRAFLDRKAPFAAAALWDGDEKKAVRMMRIPLKTSKTYRTRMGMTSMDREGRELRTLVKTTRFINARDLTKKYDWNTIK